jgi:hypothetical protein
VTTSWLSPLNRSRPGQPYSKIWMRRRRR